VFFIGCDPARGIACQERHNFQVRSLDTCTKNRHASQDDVGRYTLANLQAMLAKTGFKHLMLHSATRTL